MNGIGIGRLTSEHRRQSKRDESRSDHFFWMFFAYLECDSGCYYMEEGLMCGIIVIIKSVKLAYMDEGEGGGTYNNFDHHAPISTCEPTTP